jgi:hypothetical protein
MANRLNFQLTTILLLVGLTNCEIEEPIEKPSVSINESIDEGLIPDNIPQSNIKKSNPRLEKLLLGNDSVWCTTYMVDRTERIKSFDYFYAQDKNDIWPGNILQSKYLRNEGRAISIGSFPKDKLDYSIVGSQGSLSFEIQSPSFGSYNSALDDNSKYFWFMKPNYSYFQIQQTYSSEQALLDLGINFDFLINGVRGSFKKQDINDHQTIYMLVKSNYFDVSVAYPSNPAGFFGPSVNVDDLSRVISSDNPPAYISSVTYGRVALVKIKSNRSQKETIGAVDLLFRGLSANLTVTQREIIENSTITVEAAPGATTTLQTLEDVIDFMNEGYEFNHRTGFVPVGYEARYLKDNSPLMTHTTLSYKVLECL